DIAQIPAALDGIRKLLVDNGYFDPKVEPVYEYDEEYQQIDVTFRVKVGKRARYETPEITGDTTSGGEGVLDKSQITKATRWHRFLLPGYRGITLNRTRGGIDNIRLKYQNKNRLMATVVLNEIDPDGKTGQPKITVDPGPTVKITTPG